MKYKKIIKDITLDRYSLDSELRSSTEYFDEDVELLIDELDYNASIEFNASASATYSFERGSYNYPNEHGYEINNDLYVIVSDVYYNGHKLTLSNDQISNIGKLIQGKHSVEFNK